MFYLIMFAVFRFSAVDSRKKIQFLSASRTFLRPKNKENSLSTLEKLSLIFIQYKILFILAQRFEKSTKKVLQYRSQFSTGLGHPAAAEDFSSSARGAPESSRRVIAAPRESFGLPPWFGGASGPRRKRPILLRKIPGLFDAKQKPCNT